LLSLLVFSLFLDMKFWEFWREWGRNVWANKYGKRIVHYIFYGVALFVMLLLDQITGCGSWVDY